MQRQIVIERPGITHQARDSGIEHDEWNSSHVNWVIADLRPNGLAHSVTVVTNLGLPDIQHSHAQTSSTLQEQIDAEQVQLAVAVKISYPQRCSTLSQLERGVLEGSVAVPEQEVGAGASGGDP